MPYLQMKLISNMLVLILQIRKAQYDVLFNRSLGQYIVTVLFSIQLSNIGSTILSHYNQKPFNWRNKNEKVLVIQSLSFTTIFLIQIFTTIFTTVFLVTQSKEI